MRLYRSTNAATIYATNDEFYAGGIASRLFPFSCYVKFMSICCAAACIRPHCISTAETCAILGQTGRTLSPCCCAARGWAWPKIGRTTSISPHPIPIGRLPANSLPRLPRLVTQPTRSRSPSGAARILSAAGAGQLAQDGVIDLVFSGSAIHRAGIDGPYTLGDVTITGRTPPTMTVTLPARGLPGSLLFPSRSSSR